MTYKILTWSEILDSERSAIEESSSANGVHYEILTNQQYTDQKYEGYTLYRISDVMGEHEDGYIYENGVACGCGIACAIGVPLYAIKKSIDEIKLIAEKDVQNISFEKILLNKFH